MITEKQYLEYLITQYQNLIYSICLKSVGNPFDAEDLTQEVFLSAYKNLSRFDGTYEKAWLSKIAVRKCLDYLKAAGRRSIPTEDTYFSQIPDQQSSPEDEYMLTDSNARVKALQRSCLCAFLPGTIRIRNRTAYKQKSKNNPDTALSCKSYVKKDA